MDTQTVPYQSVVLLGWEPLSVSVPKIVFFLLSLQSLNLLKCLLNISVASRKYKASEIDSKLSSFNVAVTGSTSRGCGQQSISLKFCYISTQNLAIHWS